MFLRACSLSSGATASSRSRKMMSACGLCRLLEQRRAGRPARQARSGSDAACACSTIVKLMRSLPFGLIPGADRARRQRMMLLRPRRPGARPGHGYRSASWRCRRGQASPGPRADRPRWRPDGWRTRGAAHAARAGPGRARPRAPAPSAAAPPAAGSDGRCGRATETASAPRRPARARRPHGEPGLQGRARRPADRHHALLAALAAHGQHRRSGARADSGSAGSSLTRSPVA